VVDFPFADDASRSAWLVTLLTLIGRQAFTGPTPMLVVAANLRGTGKTLLVDMIGTIATGRSVPRRTAPTEEAEWRKALLGIAIGCLPIVLIDNVKTRINSAALDAALTGESISDRILGRNEELQLPFNTVLATTANNPSVSTDIVRRGLQCRIDSRVERPEARTGFKYPDVLEHCREHRAELLGAAMTVLRAYQVAGRPAVELRPMGSYEAWSQVIRAALVWAGQPDPAVTQDDLRENADAESETTGELLPAWFAVHAEKARTVRQLIDSIADEELSPEQRALRDAICTLCDCDAEKLPPPRKFGNKLRTLKGVIRNGFVLQRAGEHGKEGVTWRVKPLEGDSGESGDSVPERTHTIANTGGPIGKGSAERQSPQSPESPGGAEMGTDTTPTSTGPEPLSPFGGQPDEAPLAGDDAEWEAI
jgi:hypothetical protein